MIYGCVFCLWEEFKLQSSSQKQIEKKIMKKKINNLKIIKKGKIIEGQKSGIKKKLDTKFPPHWIWMKKIVKKNNNEN
jgi:hypothetical protein